MFKTSPLNAGGAGSLPGQGAKVLHDLQQKKESKDRSSIVTNSIKTLKMGHSKKKKNPCAERGEYLVTDHVPLPVLAPGNLRVRVLTQP